MKVFASRDIPTQGIDLLRAEGFEVTVWQVDRPLTQPELIGYAKQSDTLLCMFSK
jgi:glyoxylate reductase